MADLRVPGIPAAPPGSYLITGRPRTRSAWLAALLATETLHCYHEAPPAHQPIDTKAPFGLCDPGAAVLYPKRALELFSDCVIIVIDRPEADARASLEQLTGGPLPHWAELEERYQWFLARADYVSYPLSSLDDYDTVRKIAALCNRNHLTRRRFELFDGLRVEQDFVKAAQRERRAA